MKDRDLFGTGSFNVEKIGRCEMPGEALGEFWIIGLASGKGRARRDFGHKVRGVGVTGVHPHGVFLLIKPGGVIKARTVGGVLNACRKRIKVMHDAQFLGLEKFLSDRGRIVAAYNVGRLADKVRARFGHFSRDAVAGDLGEKNAHGCLSVCCEKYVRVTSRLFWRP